MPKSKKPAGGRAQNFEPRYGKKRSFQDSKRHPGQSSAGTAGSKSSKHRGFRAAEENPKRRWSTEEKAGRDQARTIRGEHSRPRDSAPRAYRDDRAPQGERRRYDERPAQGRRFDDRPRYQDRPARDGRPRHQDRPARDDRPRYQDRPARGERSRFEDRPRRDDRPRYQDRPARDDRPRYDERPARDERPRYQDRPARGERSRFEDRPRRDDRPRYQDRPSRDERPRFQDRAARGERQFQDRPRRDDRFRRDERSGDRRPREFDRAAPVEIPEDVVHDRLAAQAVEATATEGTTFGDLGLGDNIVRVLAGQGAASPFPIQAAAIPAVLEGRDVLGRGRTGSGKTIAFGAPLVESLLRARAGKPRAFGRTPQALILAPTRELALQIDGTVQPIARSVGLFTTQIYGGVPQARQVGALKKGVDIVIGTPGRIQDLIDQGKLDLSDIRIVVLDEADHMSELGFLEPMQRILRLVPASAQKLLFSATLDGEVKTLVDEFLVDPAVFEVAGEDQDSGTIEHRVLVIDHRDKPEILSSLVDRDGRTLVFTRTRAYAEMLAEQFEDADIAAVALHGDLNQAKRTRNLKRLTDGKVNVLVATDVAARGIHVDDIDLVVQADAPDEYKTYLHRAGRTGRAGRAGTVVTLVTRQRRRRMGDLLGRAEIDAPFEEARPGDDVLEELTGRQLAHPTA